MYACSQDRRFEPIGRPPPRGGETRPQRSRSQETACRAARSALGQRMQIAHQALEPFVEHVRIDLRRRDIGMAEEYLYRAQIGPVLQQMAGECMPQHMRAETRGPQTRACRERLELAGKMLAR